MFGIGEHPGIRTPGARTGVRKTTQARVAAEVRLLWSGEARATGVVARVEERFFCGYARWTVASDGSYLWRLDAPSPAGAGREGGGGGGGGVGAGVGVGAGGDGTARCFMTLEQRRTGFSPVTMPGG